MTESTTTQAPINTYPSRPDNTMEATRIRQNEALKRFTEFTLYLLLLSVFLIGMLFTGQLLTTLQKDALMANHNYIPNEKQETFKIKDEKEFWRKELSNIQSTGFYNGNESYRLFVSTEGEIFCNNSLTPIGKVIPTPDSEEKSEYRKYLNDLFTQKKPFIIEFRKQTKSLLFYTNKETLVIDRIFQLESQEFIGMILRRYFFTSFKGFLYDLKVKSSEIILESEVYKKGLEIFKYFLFLGALNGFNVVLCEDYISVFGGRFQILLIGNFRKFLENSFCIKETSLTKGSKLCLVGAFVNGIEFICKTEGNSVYLKYAFERSDNEILKIKFLTVFGYGPLKEAERVFQELRNRVLKGYETQWLEILKNDFSEKALVESFYGVETGWGVFDGVSLSGEMREAIPVISSLTDV